jgi:hypothetical protein
LRGLTNSETVQGFAGREARQDVMAAVAKGKRLIAELPYVRSHSAFWK